MLFVHWGSMGVLRTKQKGGWEGASENNQILFPFISTRNLHFEQLV